MASTPRGTCLVCGTETANRCSRCLADAHIDLFFCSPECQKLAWAGHKLFCGQNAFPLAFPLLSPAEVEAALRNLDEPVMLVDVEDIRPSVTIAGSLYCELGLSRSDIAGCIRALSLDIPPERQPADPKDVILQHILLVARFVREPGDGRVPARDAILNSLSTRYSYLVQAKLMPPFIGEATSIQATLFHHLVAAAACALAQDATQAESANGQHHAHSAIGAATAYATTHFSPDAGETLRRLHF